MKRTLTESPSLNDSHHKPDREPSLKVDLTAKLLENDDYIRWHRKLNLVPLI